MEGTKHPRDPPAYLVCVLGALLFAASLLQTGYRVFSFHQAIQLPIINLLNDPSLYPGDPYRDALLRYPSLLWHVVAWSVRFLPLESLLLGGFLFERLLVMVAAAYAARALVPKSRLAMVSAMALFALPVTSLLGSGTIETDYFEQTALAVAFFLLAIGAFYEARPIFWAFCMAVGFNLQSMYGLFAMSYFVVAFALDSDYRKAWRHWLTGFVLFSLLALPALLLSRSVVGQTPTDNSLWLLASRVRSSDHDYPLTWPRKDFARFFTIVAVLLALLWHQRLRFPKLFRHGVIWTAVALGWIVVAFVVAYVIVSPTLLIFQPARATDLWTCFAATALASLFASRVEESDSGAERALAIIFLGASFLLWRPTISPYLVGLCLLVYGIRPLWNYFLGQAPPKRVAWLLTLWLFYSSLISFKGRMAENHALVQRPPMAVETIASWASTHTPRDTIFLVDPYLDDWDMFRALSKRSVYTTSGEGGAINWDRSFAGEWVRRLALLGDDLSRPSRAEPDRLYENLRDQNIRTVQMSYRLDYWIVPVGHPSQFPVVFESHGSKVLDLRQRPD